LILYEAPHRIRATLIDMQAILGDRVTAVGRELTKVHENLVVRPISQQLAGLLEERGEFTLVVAGATAETEAVMAPAAAQLASEFGHMTNNEPLGRREAIRTLAQKYRISAREVFALLEEAKRSGY
jgi:16S rRNA (cytidine1402-2'-O)-methyltransferase